MRFFSFVLFLGLELASGKVAPPTGSINLLQPFHAPSEEQQQQAQQQAGQQQQQQQQQEQQQQQQQVAAQQAEKTVASQGSDHSSSSTTTVKESEYEVYGWWDVDCGKLGQPACKSFKGDAGWCWVPPLGTANRTMLVPAVRADNKKYCEKCGNLNLPACPTMNGTWYCFPEDELTGKQLLPSFSLSDPKPGVFSCVECGSEGQLACVGKGAPYCKTGEPTTLDNALPMCGPCGGGDEPACTSASDGIRFCLESGTVVGGLCHSAKSTPAKHMVMQEMQRAHRKH